MSTLNGYANPEGEVAIPDGGMAGVNLYSANPAPVVALGPDPYDMADYMGQADASAAPAPATAPAPAPAPAPPTFSIGTSVSSARVLLPALVGGVFGWCCAADDDYMAKMKSAGTFAVGVGVVAAIGDWLSSRAPASQ